MITEGEYRALLIAVCCTQLHVREEGHNAGAMIERYQKAGGGRKGDAWCAWFFHWVGTKVELGMGEIIPATGIKQQLLDSGYVPSILNHAKQNDLVTHSPKLADAVILLDATGHPYHIERYLGDLPDGKIATIGGNTGTPQKVDGVAYKERRRSECVFVSVWRA